MEHILKTEHHVWLAVKRGDKLFEVRKNDRLFQTGDTVILRKLEKDGFRFDRDPDAGRFSYQDLKFKIGLILQGGQYGIEPNYCVFQLEPSAS